MGLVSGFRKCVHGCDFSSPVFTFSENEIAFFKTGEISSRTNLGFSGGGLKIPRFTGPRTYLRNRLSIEIYAGACGRSPSERDSIDWVDGICIGRP